MNIKQALSTRDHRLVRPKIVAYIEDNPEVFDELVSYFLDDNYNRLSQNVTWPLGKLVENNPKLIAPYLNRMIALLENEQTVDGLKRNIYRTLQWAIIPEEQEGRLFELSFAALSSYNEPVAVRVFAMTVAFNIAIKYPELATELRLVIATGLPHGSAGYKSRAKKLLKKIDKMLATV